MKQYLSLSALTLAAAITLSGCGSDAGNSAPAGDGSSSSQETAETSTEHNDADVSFAQLMIPHHQQAVEMSELMLTKQDISPEVSDLATRIKDAQAPEIETMTAWLQAWGEPVQPDDMDSADGHSMEGHDMGSTDGADEADGSDGANEMAGMLSEDQMAELETATGNEAVRLFLESMIAHHDGAVDMAQDEIENGKNAEAIALAEEIVETQQAEIQQMDEMLADL
ncbi:DUF305 domain-containing protein [Arthrobacter tecti]